MELILSNPQVIFWLIAGAITLIGILLFPSLKKCADQDRATITWIRDMQDYR